VKRGRDLKRLILVDFMKGLFVLFLIVFHALAYNIITDLDSTMDSVDPILLIISYPIGIIGTWAGFFFWLTV
jgi:uncharacterized membrane protein